MSLPLRLEGELEKLARVPLLLVASDYDGTLAPIVRDPDSAWPLREAIVALRVLAELPQTYVGVISGRSLAELARLSGLERTPRVHLVGSHGSEFDADFAETLDPAATTLLRELEDELRAIAQETPGSRIEVKPASVAFHVRGVAPELAERALERIETGPGARIGVHRKAGKKVLELGVVGTDKGTALESIRRRVAASAVVFFGDDQTDEDVFAMLRGPDIGVKVGDGPSRAALRVEDPLTVAQALARLSELRAAWLECEQAQPIEEHALLSDQRTLALLDRRGSVTWMCLPRVDSPALFAELLGGPAAGSFTIRELGEERARAQSYVGDSMIVRTEWPHLTVTDFLDCSHGRNTQRAGRSDLVRIIEGRGRATIELAPRLDFGRVATRLLVREGGLEILEAPDPIVVRSPGVPWTLHSDGQHHTARAEVELGDEPVALILAYGTAGLRNNLALASRRADTERLWQGWAGLLRLPRLRSDLVRRSALLIKALCYGPTGAICAAATTSLPEHIGGVRNWDYRYCWLRDAMLSAHALVELGSTREAMELLDWLALVIESCDSPERLRPLYSVTGRNVGPEAEIGELSGYRGSRPVRIGNAAAHQVQLDVFGPIVELVARLWELDAPLRSEHWRLVEGMADAVVRRWREPDHGIWEIRKPKRHHVHSKVMCWLALSRALQIEDRLHDHQREDWTRERDTIASEILTHGFKPHRDAFTAGFDGDDLDAAALWVGLSGLVSPEDPRFAGTVAAIERELRDGPTVYRYRADDGLPGREGGFPLCTSWLIDAYLLVGREAEARALFEQLCALVGPSGLFAEQYDPLERRALGNVPQAYSHLGLILNAQRLSALDSVV